MFHEKQKSLTGSKTVSGLRYVDQTILPLEANKKSAGFQDLNIYIYQVRSTGDLKEQQGTPEHLKDETTTHISKRNTGAPRSRMSQGNLQAGRPWLWVRGPGPRAAGQRSRATARSRLGKPEETLKKLPSGSR